MNVGKLTRGTSGGTYAHLTVHPYPEVCMRISVIYIYICLCCVVCEYGEVDEGNLGGNLCAFDCSSLS